MILPLLSLVILLVADVLRWVTGNLDALAHNIADLFDPSGPLMYYYYFNVACFAVVMLLAMATVVVFRVALDLVSELYSDAIHFREVMREAQGEEEERLEEKYRADKEAQCLAAAKREAEEDRAYSVLEN